MKNNEAEQSPSMEQILQTIRGVMVEGADPEKSAAQPDDILELTDMVAENGKIVSLKNTAEVSSDQQKENASHNNDLLSSIDNIVSKNNKQPDTQAAERQVVGVDVAAKSLEVQISSQGSDINSEDKLHSEVTPEKTKVYTENISNIGLMNSESEKRSESSLISEEVAATTANALKTMFKSTAKQHGSQTGKIAFRSGTTVEDLVLEIIKPYLKEWLDANLTVLVKQILEKEIQKLIPKEDD
jgi:hypothetical protein